MNNDQKKELKKYFKIGIVIFIIVIIYIFVALKIGGKTPITNLKEKYLIVGNYLILKYEDGTWKQVNKMNDKILENKFSLYDGLVKKDDLFIEYASNKFIFLNSNYEETKIENFRYAFVGIDDIKPANYTWEFYENVDKNYLQSFLNKNNISKIDSFIFGTTKTTYDFDNDGTKETIYTTTNESLSEVKQTNFSGIFMVQNNKITTISNEDGPYYVQEVLDIDNDGTYEIIVSNGVINRPTFESCYQIYKMKNKKWEIIKDCEN